MSSVMTKERLRRPIKSKRKKSKKKKANQMGNALPALTKQHASRNWINFLKSNGMVKKLKTFYEKSKQNLDKKPLSAEITKVLSLDCEMVADVNNMDMLARVSIVNYKLECVYDKFVKPTSEVGDYRTRFSGVRKENLMSASDYEVVRQEVLNILKNKILVGHALHNDLRVLKMDDRNILIRDTSTFPRFRDLSGARTPSLKKLAKLFLNETIQEGEHCSVEDAKTAMKLYKKFNQEWEVNIKHKFSKRKQQVQCEE